MKTKKRFTIIKDFILGIKNPQTALFCNTQTVLPQLGQWAWLDQFYFPPFPVSLYLDKKFAARGHSSVT